MGSCLSGGLDSSSIVGLIQKMEASALTQLLRDGLRSSNDEWEWAGEVVGKYGIMSHVTHPDVDGFLAELPDFLWQRTSRR